MLQFWVGMSLFLSLGLAVLGPLAVHWRHDRDDWRAKAGRLEQELIKAAEHDQRLESVIADRDRELRQTEEDLDVCLSQGADALDDRTRRLFSPPAGEIPDGMSNTGTPSPAKPKPGTN